MELNYSTAQFFIINLPEVLINDYVVINEFFEDDEIEVINDIKDTYNSDKTKLNPLQR